MTLNIKTGVFINFLAIWGWDTFQKRIAPKSLQTDQAKLRLKFSAFQVSAF